MREHLDGGDGQEHEANNSAHRSIEGLCDSERNYTFSTTTSNQLRQLRANLTAKERGIANNLQLQQQNQQLRQQLRNLRKIVVLNRTTNNRYSWRSVILPPKRRFACVDRRPDL